MAETDPGKEILSFFFFSYSFFFIPRRTYNNYYGPLLGDCVTGHGYTSGSVVAILIRKYTRVCYLWNSVLRPLSFSRTVNLFYYYRIIFTYESSDRSRRRETVKNESGKSIWFYVSFFLSFFSPLVCNIIFIYTERERLLKKPDYTPPPLLLLPPPPPPPPPVSATRSAQNDPHVYRRFFFFVFHQRYKIFLFPHRLVCIY